MKKLRSSLLIIPLLLILASCLFIGSVAVGFTASEAFPVAAMSPAEELIAAPAGVLVQAQPGSVIDLLNVDSGFVLMVEGLPICLLLVLAFTKKPFIKGEKAESRLSSSPNFVPLKFPL